MIDGDSLIYTYQGSNSQCHWGHNLTFATAGTVGAIGVGAVASKPVVAENVYDRLEGYKLKVITLLLCQNSYWKWP